ncbi:hypothetical protein LCGC14_0454390 [marine sediment metagenome]|uniref:TRAM domain-containing protein n=1 Tax=marine sediment metagenome TaxID=412755 RepID=A0A0F9V3M3_9ZZZZ|nr:PIN/TRAM domain-containing protein [Phycisphaerae bacterium]HDZ45274.1 PIN/TRAM domain-containing protein [Phycisphaerae bacterium]
MVIHVIRVVFLLVVLAITLSFALQPDVYSEGTEFVTTYILLPTIAAVGLVLVDMWWRRKRLQALSGLFFGLLAGLVIAFVLGLLIDLTVNLYAPPMTDHPGAEPFRQPGMTAEAYQIQRNVYQAALQTYQQSSGFRKSVELAKLLLGSAAVFMCVSFVLQTRDSFRFIIPYVEFSREMRGARPLLLDTSVIIDGRIADIAETRILESNIIVPRFVLDELQAIADASDKLKRNRGRRGLDILSRLRSNDKLSVQIMDASGEDVGGEIAVDAKLVALGKRLNGRVVTNDYNLNKIAELRGVDVININDLANAVKPVVLPGETMTIKVIRAGDEPGQGVGFLDDGTMVVAEGGRDHIGRDVHITVTSALQTSAGRMIFGKIDSEQTNDQGPLTS